MTTLLQTPTDQDYILPQWAPRLPKAKIAQLYVSNAEGILDEDLIEYVGIGLYARCESIITATEAAKGRLPCPLCGHIIHHRLSKPPTDKNQKMLRCDACDWVAPWKAYIKTYRGKQLSAGGMAPFFRAFIKEYPSAKTPREKMILIDTLIHRFHHELENRIGRIGGVNLIQGRMVDVIDFLRHLTYSDKSLPEVKTNLRLWLAKKDQRSKKKKKTTAL